ncbi:hypothetical protein FQZ97_1100800 [compost metagenome]
MAAGTDFTEHLEAALQLVGVVGAENASKAPALLLDRHGASFGRLRGSAEREAGNQCDSGEDRLDIEHCSCPFHHACDLPRTLSEMLVGNGFGFSIRPRSGRMTRKCAK